MKKVHTILASGISHNSIQSCRSRLYGFKISKQNIRFTIIKNNNNNSLVTNISVRTYARQDVYTRLG